MKKRIVFPTAVLLLCLTLPFAVSAADPFPFDEIPEYRLRYNYNNYYNVGSDREGKPAFDATLTYSEYDENNREVYRQQAYLEYAAPESLFNWFSSDAEKGISERFSIEERHGFSEDYQYEEYGSRFFNRVSSRFSVKLYEIEVYLAQEGKTLEETMAAKAEEEYLKLSDQSYWYGRLYNTLWLSGSEYTNQLETPATLTKRDDGYLVVGHAMYRGDRNIEGTFFYHGELEPYTGFESNYGDVKQCTYYFTLPELPGAFLAVTYYQTAAFYAGIEQDKETAYEALYREQGPRYEEFLALDLAETFAKDSSLITVTWNDPVDSRTDPAETKEETTASTAEPETENESVIRDAERETGEDSGVSVPGLIAGAAAAVGAAAIGAGAVAGSA
ncbi:MAG: hypothetical protein II719_03690, partial [Clostridia bacterium]|nr:hypothetical protein [Clostridia bacterium]